MWLLGAGASAAAGIPTAWDKIWDFKQKIYASQKHVSLKSGSDLGSPAIWAQLESYFHASGTYPAAGMARVFVTGSADGLGKMAAELLIEACGGDVRAAVKALIVANSMLEQELSALYAKSSTGYLRAVG